MPAHTLDGSVTVKYVRAIYCSELESITSEKIDNPTPRTSRCSFGIDTV